MRRRDGGPVRREERGGSDRFMMVAFGPPVYLMIGDNSI